MGIKRIYFIYATPVLHICPFKIVYVVKKEAMTRLCNYMPRLVYFQTAVGERI